jgi:hypothetical protein
MPSNFEYLKEKPEYSLFSQAAVDAENTLTVTINGSNRSKKSP